jgi:hypothetical protein
MREGFFGTGKYLEESERREALSGFPWQCLDAP